MIGRRELIDRIRPPRTAGFGRSAGRLAADVWVYVILWSAVLVAPGWWWKILLAAGTGIAIARLFLIGHDACHRTFFQTPSWLNPVVGRLVFLPSMTPYSTWELGHNTLHHGFTNLRGKDYGYPPFSKSEYDALPAWRRLLERAYRHPLGPGLHYAIEVWWKRLWFPRRLAEHPIRARYRWDSALTLAFLCAQAAATVWAGHTTGQNPAELAAWSIAAPFAVWNAIMGFVTYQQHTHPRVVWYQDRREWDPVTAQVRGTVHVVFPSPVGALLGNIMEHTAHHLDISIPLFDLPEAQRRVEAQFSNDVTVVRWTLAYYLECCRRCKLYDYAARSWVGFDGRWQEP